MNRISRRFGAIILAGCTLLGALSACTRPEPENGGDPGKSDEPSGGEDKKDDDPKGSLPDVSAYKPSDTFTLTFQGEETFPYSGLKAGDWFEAVSVAGRDAGTTYRFEVTQSSDTEGARLSAPAKYIGGLCRMTLHQGTATRSLGDLFVDVVDRTEIPKNPGYTVYGRVVDADGNPIQGVSVSDGIFVAQTDAKGCYYLLSKRKYGYVFISVPSGYRVAVNRSIPQFFRRVTSSTTSYELKSFVLEKENNTRHRMIVFTDVHLANRTDDIKQFNGGFKKELAEEYGRAKAEGTALYAMSLGDLTWDEYWYKNTMEPKHYCAVMADVEVPVYNIPGNHDNNPYVADDFESEGPFRAAFGPTYYSFNIGGIHYIQLDNTLFSNAGAAQGVIGNVQDYKEGFTTDELTWLRADLLNVPKTTPLVIGMHIPYTNRTRFDGSGKTTFTQAMPSDMATKLLSIVQNYDVQFLSGHTHVRYTNFITGKMMEQNVGAVCGTWWWCGKYSGYRTNMCRDGAPDGYEVIDYDGTAMTAWYKGIGKDRNYQFRAYDLNNCLIDRATYLPKVATNYKTVTDALFKQYACGYDTPRSDNAVLINVFSWNEKYRVEATEVETGKKLEVRRVETYDPLHVIHFNMARMNGNSASLTFPTLLTAHMFEVTCSGPVTTLDIAVTDEFGTTYRETMTRPRLLKDMASSPQW